MSLFLTIFIIFNAPCPLQTSPRPNRADSSQSNQHWTKHIEYRSRPTICSHFVWAYKWISPRANMTECGLGKSSSWFHPYLKHRPQASAVSEKMWELVCTYLFIWEIFIDTFIECIRENDRIARWSQVAEADLPIGQDIWLSHSKPLANDQIYMHRIYPPCWFAGF